MARVNNITVSQLSDIKRYHAEGLSQTQIATKLNLPYHKIHYIFHYLGLTKKVPPITLEEKQSFLEDHQAGMTIIQIAKKHNRSITRLRTFFHSQNILFPDNRYKYIKQAL